MYTENQLLSMGFTPKDLEIALKYKYIEHYSASDLYFFTTDIIDIIKEIITFQRVAEETKHSYGFVEVVYSFLCHEGPFLYENLMKEIVENKCKNVMETCLEDEDYIFPIFYEEEYEYKPNERSN